MSSIIQRFKGTGARKAIAIAAMLALAALVAAVAACSAPVQSGDIGAGGAIGEALTDIAGKVGEIELPDQEPADDKQPEEQAADVEEEAAGDEHGDTGDEHGQAPRERKAATQAEADVSDTIPSSPDEPDAAPDAQAPPQQRKWVEETDQVWVEDKAAWTEQVPVYGTREVSICNICGEDITGDTAAHGKAHMLAGEGSGHHSEVRSDVVGYDTVSHAAEGHWETCVTGGHWE